MLAHYAAQPPRCQRIVEPLVGNAHRLLVREGYSCVIETRQIAHPIIRGGGHDPGITAIAQDVSESAIVLKEKDWLRGERCGRRGPIHGVVQVNVEVRDQRPSLLSHVRRRWKVGLLDVLQITDQRLLRRAARTGIPLDCTLVDHDREREAGMGFSFCHDEFGGLVFVIVRTIPIDDHAIDSAADHVGDLSVNVRGVRGTVTDVHVVRASEPDHEVGIDLGGRA